MLTLENPGFFGRIPATIVRRSKFGCALHACESDLVGSGCSAHVVRPRPTISRQGLRSLRYSSPYQRGLKLAPGRTGSSMLLWSFPEPYHSLRSLDHSQKEFYSSRLSVFHVE